MFGDILYNLFITPIEMIIEFFFSIIYKFAHNPGIAILGVSLVVNFLVLPLYKKSDALSEAEREKQKEMKPWLDHIKKAFKGDERYMMTQTYYRQQDYKPIYALKSSLSLLLQIPFFIAAYHYLSHLDLLKNASFLIFSNLGEPDQLIPFFGGIKLNLLPILMTAINIVSGAIYTKGFPLKEKLQLYGMALIFLVLLYDSPSGLVFYWTLNNIFSLCKNIVMKVLPKREKKVKPDPTPLPKSAFFLGTLFLTLFMGAYIPLSVINASPAEFISLNYEPSYLLIYTLSAYIGFFMIWVSIFYYLCSPRGKNIFTYIIWLCAGIFAVNFFFFGNHFGNISAYLIFDDKPVTGLGEKLINIGAVLLVGLAFYFIIKKWPKLPASVYKIVIIAVVVLGIINIVNIQGEVKEAEAAVTEDIEDISDIEKIIPLSKTGKNVILFELDRAQGAWVSSIMEDTELRLQYDGFTFYSNTVAFGRNTNHSTPSLFGGYDYVPTKINERKDESLKDKQNEALSVLPSIFNDADYKVTVCDMPYAGTYKVKPDMSIYDRYENVTAHITNGAYLSLIGKEYTDQYESMQKRNFICYSIFKTMPLLTQGAFYDKGAYLSTSNDSSINEDFWASYSVLQNLKNITEITDDAGTLLMIENETTHEDILKVPDYDITPIATKSNRVRRSQGHYVVNVASYRQLGEWFDYLREQGVYDNTRIIICSDHGYPLADYPEMVFENFDLEALYPALLVKDFDATGDLKTDDTFMTLADIPTIVTEGLITNPTNPFTGNPINSDAKADGVIVTCSHNWNTNKFHGNTFDISDDNWYKVKDNIFDEGNWEIVDDIPKK